MRNRLLSVASIPVAVFGIAFSASASPMFQGLGYLPGDTFSNALGVSADGSTVVGSSGDEAFLWTSGGGMVGLGDLSGGGFRSVARGVSGDGSIVVGSGHSATSDHEAFIWDATNGMREVDTVLTGLGLDLTGWTLLTAAAISDDGTVITGGGLNPSGDREGWIAIIPEPSTGLLVASGLVGLASYRRGRVRG